MAATCCNPLALSGVKSISSSSSSSSSSLFLKPPKRTGRSSGAVKISKIRADYRDTNTGGGGGGDFVAGFLVGGAVCGTLAYIFAPQMRKSLLIEDEYGVTIGRKPMFYDNQDDGLERTRQTLSKKIGQLNSAIDKVSYRLRAAYKNRNNTIPLEADLEEEIMF